MKKYWTEYVNLSTTKKILITLFFWPFLIFLFIWKHEKLSTKKKLLLSLLVFSILIMIGNRNSENIKSTPAKTVVSTSIQKTKQTIENKEEIEQIVEIKTEPQEKIITEKSETSNTPPVQYEIVEEKDNSIKALTKKLSSYSNQEIANLPINKKMQYRIVVSPQIKEAEVMPTIHKIIQDITQRDNDIDEIGLLLYSDKEIVNSMYDVAMATWAPNGEYGNVTPEIAKNNYRSIYKTKIQITENLEEYLKNRSKSEEKFGYTDSERKQIFKEVVAAEKRANNEAEKVYPLDKPGVDIDYVKKYGALSNQLMAKYVSAVRKKYNLTEDEETQISVEGVMKNWPMD